MIRRDKNDDRAITPMREEPKPVLVRLGGDPKQPIYVFNALRARGLTPLADEICRQRGVLMHELCGRGRAQSVARARQELWWRIWRDQQRQMSFNEIAGLFGRDHTTVAAGVRAYDSRARRRG
jgi:hypothetical protein